MNERMNEQINEYMNESMNASNPVLDTGLAGSRRDYKKN